MQLFQLIIFVVFLIAVTYAWKSPQISANRSRKSSGRRSSNPFQGRHTAPPPRGKYHTIDKGAMTRCHNCSTFFPMGQVVHEIVEGHLLEFCSNNCRQNFLKPGYH